MPAEADDSHLTPDSPAGYRVEFDDAYKNMHVDKNSPLWKEAIADAFEAKLSHSAFKVMVNRHAKRVMDAHVEKTRTRAAAPAATLAPAKPAAPTKALKDMTFTERMVAAGHV